MREMIRHTERLTLVAATADHLRAEIACAENLAILLGAHIPPGWPPGEYDADAQRVFLHSLAIGGDSCVGWYGWYAMCGDDGHGSPTLIGTGGFLGPPDHDGHVELGYSVHPHWQNRGYATELVRELLSFAFGDKRVTNIVAHTTRDNIASHRVLEKLGFSEAGTRLEQSAVQYRLIRDRLPVDRRLSW